MGLRIRRNRVEPGPAQYQPYCNCRGWSSDKWHFHKRIAQVDYERNHIAEIQKALI